MVKKFYKALEPITLDREYRPGDTFEADESDVAGKDVVDLGAVASNNANAAPTDEAERIAAIVAAIGNLNVDNGALWSKNGTPKTEAISEVTGWPVAAKERDAAWAQINAAK